MWKLIYFSRIASHILSPALIHSLYGTRTYYCDGIDLVLLRILNEYINIFNREIVSYLRKKNRLARKERCTFINIMSNDDEKDDSSCLKNNR